MAVKALTERERRFVEAYMGQAVGNGTEASRLAGYAGTQKVLQVQASRLLSKAIVKAEIAKRQLVRAREADIDAARVLREMARIGLSDPRSVFSADSASLLLPHEWADDTARAIASIEVVVRPTGDKEQPVEHLHKIKFWDKNAALANLAKHLGMFIERHDVTSGGEIVKQIINNYVVAVTPPTGSASAR